MSILCCLKIKMSYKNCETAIVGKMDKDGWLFNVELSAGAPKLCIV